MTPSQNADGRSASPRARAIASSKPSAWPDLGPAVAAAGAAVVSREVHGARRLSRDRTHVNAAETVQMQDSNGSVVP
jgi:hypothetical protein